MTNQASDTLQAELKTILLQYHAELNQGLNELAGHGTAIEQAQTALLAAFKAYVVAVKPEEGKK